MFFKVVGEAARLRRVMNYEFNNKKLRASARNDTC